MIEDLTKHSACRRGDRENMEKINGLHAQVPAHNGRGQSRNLIAPT